MRIIVKPGETLSAVLSGSPATTNPAVLMDYLADGNWHTSMTALNGATAVNLLAPTTYQHEVHALQVYNVDTAAVTLSLQRTISGTTYTVVSLTLQVGDHLEIDAAGMRIVDTNGQMKSSSSSTALQAFAISATEWRKTDGVTVNGASAATTNFGVIYGTDGTGFPHLETIDSKNATTAVVSRCIVKLPPNYVAGSAITLRALAGMKTTVASNSGATTLGFNVYSNAGAGNLGSADLNATAAQSINSLTLANKDFTITPTGLVAGQDLHIKMTLTVTDSATGTAVIGTVNHVELRTTVTQ